MKIVFIHATSPVDVRMPEDAVAKLPKGVCGVVTNAQHIDAIQPVLDQLPKAKLAGQVLGCNALGAEEMASDVDFFLFVGTGVFHPLNVAWKTRKPVWIWNPVSQNVTRIGEDEVVRYEKHKMGLFNKFLHASTVGILVSVKWGQKNMVHALEFSQRTDKKYYVFVGDTLDVAEFENFPFVDCWVNSACPRLADEKEKLVNLDDLAEFLDHTFKRHVERPIWKTKV